jgi:predicted transport protein
VQQINRNIELIRYRRFGEELLLLELVNAISAGNGGAGGAKGGKATKAASDKGKTSAGDKTYAECLESMSDSLKVLLASLEDYIISLGDDVQKKELKLYAAYKRLKNFTSVVIQKNRLLLYLNLNPAKLAPLPAIARDVSQSGHWGTGDLELAISSSDDLDLAKSFIRMAYEGRGGR